MDLWTVFSREGSNTKTSIHKDNRGLTLVELMLGITILAIVVVPLLHVFVTGASTEVKSRKYGDATDAAQNLIEQVQAADVDLILSNSVAVDMGAIFYTLNGAIYESTKTDTNPGTKAPELTASDPKLYYIGIENYTYNGSAFDALITLNASSSDTANTTPVVVGNKMDALLNMSDVDANAVVALQAECGDLVADPLTDLTSSDLTRSVTLNVTKPTATSYQFDAVFTYNAIIAYTVDTKSYTYYFSHTEQASQNVGNVVDPTDGSPALSVFLFFNAYYKDFLSQETIHINNQTANDMRSDINVFLVNTGSANLTQTNYRAGVWYKYQKFGSDNKPINTLVFTNLDDSDETNQSIVIYYAFTSDLLRKTIPVSGYLVETKQINRKFTVDVKLFKSGTNFSGTPIVDIDSTKLNY